MKIPFCSVSIALALSTLIVSSAVATIVRGSPWRNVPILQLRDYGAVDNEQLADGQWWRLLTAQFVHVKQSHMLFNVAALFLLGAAVEQAIGPFVLFFVWLLGGITGVMASILFVAPPYDIGSGASQALMGIAAAGLVVMMRKEKWPRWLKPAVLAVIGIQLALDLVSAHHPQPGHVVGFAVGFILAAGLVSKPLGDSA